VGFGKVQYMVAFFVPGTESMGAVILFVTVPFVTHMAI